MTSETSGLEERAARNQSRFREHNERVEGSNAMHVWFNPPLPDWTCECPNELCTEPVRMSVAEYEAVRAQPTHFLVAPSPTHVIPAVERVVALHERYWIVEKIDDAAEISEVLDPRSARPEA